jgi:riboflavin kinase/FMN adenylyltransferase
MDFHTDFRDLNLDSCFLTIGSFDGVHLGHQKLLNNLIDLALKEDLPSVVLTFYPHPSVVLRKRTPSFYIHTPEEKAEQLFTLGVDHVINQAFDTTLASYEASVFLDMLEAQLGFQGLWIGEDFALGHNREGNRRFLENESTRRDFSLHIIPPVLLDGEIISSTRVREALRSGDVRRVARYLGQPFRIPGEVISGEGRGKNLNIPTANLRVWQERAYPTNGVYACLAEIEGEKKAAVTNIGIRPTFNESASGPVIETHVLDFDQSLYGEEIILYFIDRLRDERKFSGPDQLIQQIHRDIERARRKLKQYEEVKGDG